jgi:hypothetical protein
MRLHSKLILLLIILFAASCEPIDDINPSSLSAGVCGQLKATNYKDERVLASDTIRTAGGSASAYIYTSPGNNLSYADAGNIWVEDSALTKGTNNIYTFNEAPTWASNILTWKLRENNTANAWRYQDSTVFPTLTLPMPYEANKLQDLLIAIPADLRQSADSIRIYIADGGGVNSLTKTAAADTTTLAISAAEMSPFQTNTPIPGRISISAAKQHIAVINGKAYLFIKETKRSQDITFF